MSPEAALAQRVALNELGMRTRRSTRLLQAVPLRVAGVDAGGRQIEEQTATLSINCHGCRYFSRYRREKETWLILEIPGGEASQNACRLRARVAWVQKSSRLRGLFQVGVEFETPGNVWSIPSPPADWRRFAPRGGSSLAALEPEIKRLLALAETGTYYQLLGVTGAATRAQIKRNFYELARKFHPDHHMARREGTQALQSLMEAFTLAYRTLSDATLREEYDRRLAASGAFTLGSSKTEAQKSAEECLERARECLRACNYVASILWLRKAVESEPSSSKCHALLARSLAAVPRYRRDAVVHFERALELDPLNAEAHFQFAVLYEELNLPWRARPHYERVVELDPNHRGARERLRQLKSAEKKKDHPEVSLLARLLSRLSK